MNGIAYNCMMEEAIQVTWKTTKLVGWLNHVLCLSHNEHLLGRSDHPLDIS